MSFLEIGDTQKCHGEFQSMKCHWMMAEEGGWSEMLT
jgi:hypothetical protein